jgi:hypothetical protein
MAFEKLVTKYKSPNVKSDLPATISLTKRGKAKLPSLHIGFKKSFVGDLPDDPAERFSLLIGTGEDKGIIRLVRDAEGSLKLCFTAAGGAILHAGKTDYFGAQVRDRVACAAELVDGDTVEITLPPWALDASSGT